MTDLRSVVRPTLQACAVWTAPPRFPAQRQRFTCQITALGRPGGERRGRPPPPRPGAPAPVLPERVRRVLRRSTARVAQNYAVSVRRA